MTKYYIPFKESGVFSKKGEAVKHIISEQKKGYITKLEKGKDLYWVKSGKKIKI